MVYNKTMTRKERNAKEATIPGSRGWALTKSDGYFGSNAITRNNLKFSTNRRVSSSPNYNEEAQSNGWKFNPQTQTWKHPSYNDHTFPSIYQTLLDEDLWEYKLPVPYHNNDDEFGLAYNYTIGCSGQSMKIFPNKWISEEFDTRHGKRRELWRYKKEMREKHALQFQTYKEQQREMEKEQNEYEREFVVMN